MPPLRVGAPARHERRRHPKAEEAPWAAGEGLGKWKAGSPSRLSFNEQTHKDLEAINPELGLQNQTWLQIPLGTGEQKEEDSHNTSRGAQELCPLLKSPSQQQGCLLRNERALKGPCQSAPGKNVTPKSNCTGSFELSHHARGLHRTYVQAARVGRFQEEQLSLYSWGQQNLGARGCRGHTRTFQF